MEQSSPLPYAPEQDARGETAAVYREMKPLREIAADASRGLEERLEAYADIIDSEVGDTSMVRARNIERETGLRQVYLKFEGGNPTGTQKDRIAFDQVRDALRRGFDTVTVATCGNYGAAMALAASLAGLECLIFIPEGYQTKRLEEMTALGAKIERVAGDYEHAVELSSARARTDELYDANPGGENTPLQLDSYGRIAAEIYDELRDAPAVIAAPVSNGTTLAGLHKGFLSLHRRGKTSRIPRMVAGSSYRKNPIVRAFLAGKERCEDLARERIRETPVNEPLINWHALDGDLALHSLRASNGWAGDVSDRGMTANARILRDKEGMHVLPASTAGLVALLECHARDPLPNDRYVVLLTGRKA